jgi:predicted nucleotidyltransferase
MLKRSPAIPSWLDTETSRLVEEIVDSLIKRHPDILAIILYGSVARHEERALDDLYPSDVDVLIVVDTDNRRGIRVQEEALFNTLGDAKMRHLTAPREVNAMFATRTSQEWDPEFIENVKRDGIILSQRGELPKVFAA